MEQRTKDTLICGCITIGIFELGRRIRNYYVYTQQQKKYLRIVENAKKGLKFDDPRAAFILGMNSTKHSSHELYEFIQYAALEGIQEAKLELAKIFKSDLTHREQFQKELADVSPDTAKEDGDTGRFQKAHEIFHKLGARITSSSRDKFTNTKYREQREDVWEESDIVDPYGSKLLDDLATELKAALASHETCVDPGTYMLELSIHSFESLQL